MMRIGVISKLWVVCLAVSLTAGAGMVAYAAQSAQSAPVGHEVKTMELQGVEDLAAPEDAPEDAPEGAPAEPADCELAVAAAPVEEDCDDGQCQAAPGGAPVLTDGGEDSLQEGDYEIQFGAYPVGDSMRLSWPSADGDLRSRCWTVEDDYSSALIDLEGRDIVRGCSFYRNGNLEATFDIIGGIVCPTSATSADCYSWDSAFSYSPAGERTVIRPATKRPARVTVPCSGYEDDPELDVSSIVKADDGSALGDGDYDILYLAFWYGDAIAGSPSLASEDVIDDASLGYFGVKRSAKWDEVGRISCVMMPGTYVGYVYGMDDYVGVVPFELVVEPVELTTVGFKQIGKGGAFIKGATSFYEREWSGGASCRTFEMLPGEYYLYENGEWVCCFEVVGGAVFVSRGLDPTPVVVAPDNVIEKSLWDATYDKGGTRSAQ